MAYQEIPVDTFGGLDVTNDPEEVGLAGAVDMSNIKLSSRGRLSTRNGTSTKAARADAAVKAILQDGDADVLVSWSDYEVIAYDAAWNIDSTSTGTNTPRRFVKFGTPTFSSVFFAQDGDIIRWIPSTSSFTAVPFGVGSFAHDVALSPNDNRLVVAASASASSRIHFSDAGDPTNFTINNYVDLDPGDSEQVSDLVTWRDQVFAFKQSKFFVFYGPSIDGVGKPVFNYRSVRAGIGALPISASSGPRAVAALDGVYFCAEDGVYRTTGGDPVKVSQAIDAWFQGESLPLAAHIPVTSVPLSLAADHRYVYVAVTGGTFVYDVQTTAWSFFDLVIRAVDPSDASTSVAGTIGRVVEYGPSHTDDDGTPIAWAHRTGASDLGTTVPKLVKQTQVWGSGAVTASVYADHGTTDPGAANLTLGTAPAVIRSQQFYSRQGTFFSIGLSGTGPAIIHRAVLGVAEQRLTGVA